MNLGIWTLLPPIIIILVAMKTKKTTSSLLIGALVACILAYKTNFLNEFINLMYSVGCNEDTVWYMLFVGWFGCILGIWSHTGATKALADKLRKYATNGKKTMVLTWIIGALVFIDDFTSIAVRGTMTQLYDNTKTPRAMMSYITDATGSPLNCLIAFGTWGIYYQSVFAGYNEVTSLGDTMSVYWRTVPFQFYSWAAIIIALLVALNVIKPLGAMKKEYEIADKTGQLYNSASIELNPKEDKGKENISQSTSNKLIAGFLIPLGVFITIVIINGDVITACLITLAVMIAEFLLLKLATWNELMKYCMAGVGEMLSMMIILFAAYMVRDSLITIGLPDFVISVVKPIMIPAILPAITFVVLCFLTFFSGSNWGISLPIAAIVIPLCAAISGNMYLILAAIVSGAAFGAHACFYCDVTVFTSGMTKIDNMEHATTQFPYCIIGMVASTVCFLIAGFIF